MEHEIVFWLLDEANKPKLGPIIQRCLNIVPVEDLAKLLAAHEQDTMGAYRK